MHEWHMEIIFDNDLISFCAGTVISCVYLALVTDTILRSARKNMESGMFPVFLFLSSVSALILTDSGLVSYRALYSSLPVDLALSMMIMLVITDAEGFKLQQKLPQALVASSLFLVSVVISVLRITFAGRMPEYDFSAWIPPVLSVAIAAYCLIRSIREFSDLKRFFSGMDKVRYARTAVNFNFTSMFLAVVMADISSVALPPVFRNVIWSAGTAGVVLMHIFMYRRCVLKHVFVFYDGYEKSFRTPCPAGSGTDGTAVADSGYAATYERLNSLFEEKKPYLDSDLTISDVAKELYTNKLYVSKSISMCAGKNFCQYVNYHRVKYSVGLFRSDPHLKVSQLAEMSGFHTVASFNMAFKLFIGESPSEWCRRQRFPVPAKDAQMTEQFENSET